MAKYVCDYAQVKAIGDNLINASTNMQTSVTTFSSSIESDLSTWSGSAKDGFTTQSTGQVELANQDAEKIRQAGEYIKEAAAAIEDLDNSLAALRI